MVWGVNGLMNGVWNQKPKFGYRFRGWNGRSHELGLECTDSLLGLGTT